MADIIARGLAASALSASQKKTNRFLSVWNATTGLPKSNPASLPYTYQTGDWYTIGIVGTTNYRPNGTTYTGAASTTVETETIDTSKIYRFDGASWILDEIGIGQAYQTKEILDTEQYFTTDTVEGALAELGHFATDVQQVSELDIDTAPTSSSSHLITSGGVYTAIDNINFPVDDVKVNGTTVVDQNGTANITIKNVLTSTATNEALSANMGKTLNDRITSLHNKGGFLSLWNCETGKPSPDITDTPYQYKLGDYYRVSSVAGGTYNHTLSLSGEDLMMHDWFVDVLVMPTNSTYSTALTNFTQLATAMYNSGYTSENKLPCHGEVATGAETADIVRYIAASSTVTIHLYDMNGDEISFFGGLSTISDTVTHNDTNYRPDGISYTGAASTTVETDSIKNGYVYYFNGSNWLIQTVGENIVTDVKINNTSILNSEGVANITIEDNLTSSNTSNALSANQGKVLNTNKANKSETVSNVAYDTTNDKFTQTINGTTSDIVNVTTLKSDMGLSNALTTSSIIDNLTTSDATKVLSAKQGKALNDNKQNNITSSNKLSADYVNDSSTTNKFVTAAEKSSWTSKQDALTSENAGNNISITTTGHNLPSTYTELEYLISSGTQYINTGLVPSSSSSTHFEIEVKSNANNTGSLDCCAGGCRPAGGAVAWKLPNFYGTQIETSTAFGTPSNIDYARSTDLIYKIDAQLNDVKIYVNGVSSATVPGTTYTSISYPVYLFAMNTANTIEWKFSGRIYYAKWSENRTEKFHYIPAKRNSDNVLGMYDLVSGTFKTNAGTGTFQAGPTVVKRTLINVVATQSMSLVENLCSSDGTACTLAEPLHIGDKIVVSNSFETSVYYGDTATAPTLQFLNAAGEVIDDYGLQASLMPRIIEYSNYYSRTDTTATKLKIINNTQGIEYMVVKGTTPANYLPYTYTRFRHEHYHDNTWVAGDYHGSVGSKIYFDESDNTYLSSVTTVGIARGSATRAHSVKMYLTAGTKLVSAAQFYLKRIRVDQNDIILSDSDIFDSKEREIEITGYYYIILAYNSYTALQQPFSLATELDVAIYPPSESIELPLKTMNWDTGCKNIAHSGTISTKYPRHSKEAYLEAARCPSVWGIETDVYESSDHVIMCLHDPYHGRLTSNPLGPSQNCIVQDYTYQWQYDNVTLSYDYEGTPSTYKICTFEEFLQICQEYHKIPIIDMKDEDMTWNAGATHPAGSVHCPHSTQFYDNFVSLLRKYGFEETAMPYSYIANFLVPLRQRSSKMILLWDEYQNTQGDWSVPTPSWVKSHSWSGGRCGLSIGLTWESLQYNLTREIIKSYHEAGMPVYVWTADLSNPLNYKCLEARDNGVDGVMTDFIPDIMNCDRMETHKAEERSRIGAGQVDMVEYTGMETSYEDNVLYYVIDD